MLNADGVHVEPVVAGVVGDEPAGARRWFDFDRRFGAALGGSLFGQRLAHPPDRLRVGFRVPAQRLHLDDDAIDLVDRRLLLDLREPLGEVVELVKRVNVRFTEAAPRLPPVRPPT